MGTEKSLRGLSKREFNMRAKDILKFATGVILSICLLPTTVMSQAKVNIPDDLRNTYELTPDYIRYEFENEGWDLECVDGKEINKVYGYGEYTDKGYEIAGVTVYDIKTIYLSDNTRYAETSLNHEIGHYLDYSYYTYYGIQPSMTEEFNEIFKEEAAISYMFESYELSDVREYFAQSYREFLHNNDALSRFYPKTYNYMLRIIDDYQTAVENNLSHQYDERVFMMAAKQK